MLSAPVVLLWLVSQPPFSLLRPSVDDRRRHRSSSSRNRRRVVANDDDDDIEDSYSKLRRGGLRVERDFVPASVVAALRGDVEELRRVGAFRPSGLSNRVAGDRNAFDTTRDRSTCTVVPDLARNRHSHVREEVEARLETLRRDLERRALTTTTSRRRRRRLRLAEMYYSVSPTGSCLPRHQDERHEETKGDRAWIHDTRRSVSWLLYLNDDWGSNNGGQLRAHLRRCRDDVSWCGSNDGDLQVGWWRTTPLPPTTKANTDDANERAVYEPVYLDSWIRTPNDEDDDDDVMRWRPSYALYRTKETRENHRREREYLSAPFGPGDADWPNEIDLEPSEFARALAARTTSLFDDENDNDRRFAGTENVDDDDVFVVDVVPSAGTLVLFDSVTVPHEVLPVTAGERLAIAGWFHEDQQSFPDWYGT